MLLPRASAWIFSAAVLALGLASAAPASAQGYHYGQRGDVYGAPPIYRPYQPAPPPHVRVRPVDPYYGNAPHVRRYGYGPKRHWRRWTHQPHPGWQPPGWDRPRFYDHR